MIEMIVMIEIIVMNRIEGHNNPTNRTIKYREGGRCVELV